MLIVTEHDAEWLARVGIAQRPTPVAVALRTVRRILAPVLAAALLVALVGCFTAGFVSVFVPAVAWIATSLSAGVHVVIVWVEGVLSSW